MRFQHQTGKGARIKEAPVVVAVRSRANTTARGRNKEEIITLEFLQNVFLTVATAAVPVLTAYIIVFIRKVGDNAAANTESVKTKTYIMEATEAIADAVAATKQTYVDALKKAGKFNAEAQKEAAQKALEACLASISPAAQSFIEAAYGDIKEYLKTRIEAEVRKQKNEVTVLEGYAMEGSVEIAETED